MLNLSNSIHIYHPFSLYVILSFLLSLCLKWIDLPCLVCTNLKNLKLIIFRSRKESYYWPLTSINFSVQKGITNVFLEVTQQMAFSSETLQNGRLTSCIYIQRWFFSSSSEYVACSREEAALGKSFKGDHRAFTDSYFVYKFPEKL